MSSSGISEHIESLLATADEAIQKNELSRAAETLRQASHLDSNNAQVKERWSTLQNLEAGDNALDLLREYLGSEDAQTGEHALQAVKTKQLPKDDAVQAAELLLHVSSSPQLLDSLTLTLLTRNVEARKLVAAKLAEHATEIFTTLCERGEESFKGLTSIVLDDSLWESKAKLAAAQEGIFRLCVATLIDAGVEHLERVMRCIARLLTMVPNTVAGIIDANVMDDILLCLDIRQPVALRSQATLATSKVLEATKQRGEDLFSDFITGRAAKQTNDDLIIAFSAAAAVFPVIPVVAARLFLIDGFVQRLVPNLERIWEDGAAGKRKSQSLETAALELLSAASVDKTCREAIQRYCSHWLENIAEERQGSHQALAALILAKISAESSKNITAKLEQLILSGDPDVDQAIEGLAYTSLQPKIKEEIASNSKILGDLVEKPKDRSSVAFGCLTVFTNLTTYKPNLSEEQKKVLELKAYANSSKPAPEDPLDDDAHVAARCRKVLDADVIPAIVGYCKQAASPTNIALVVRLLLALAREPQHRSKMAQQGAVKLLVQIKERVAKTDKSTAKASVIERDAAHALARLLISVNPSHVFSSSLPASTAVAALAPLLSQDQDSEQRNLLPTFEALLALTNLASMEDNGIRDLELRLAWQQLEDHLLFSSNVLVQRASVELVCNLMASPNCVAKFVGDGSKREATRLQILLALTDVEDVATRRAAGGALAMLTEWDAAVVAILDVKYDSGSDGIKALLGMCKDESDDIKHRGLVCLANVINAPGEVGKMGIERVKESGGVQVLQETLKTVKDRDILAIGVEVLKKLM